MTFFSIVPIIFARKKTANRHSIDKPSDNLKKRKPGKVFTGRFIQDRKNDVDEVSVPLAD
ncbi:hypothetical protein AU490_08960 [Lonsdalea populi]|uniref:Uncharacterized protein n=1 Tax=Lonsdalea populi TaxID=1172565 RepID=A0A3N0UTW2_9GAMM|nr:hypothetical protein AU486_15940 [Lonsdalea quercina]RAT28785.1 hypothetical protein AU490_08960 [Lonsdalea populi]RAT38391.1 hypothetical protein AU491_03790 [Lonsdalea populi]RAT49671.1 hypothetical protein AU496_00360 [Lonsdalea populi]RAT53755.1 hypothetical protein AU498_06225 [Lonsdalea populi]